MCGLKSVAKWGFAVIVSGNDAINKLNNIASSYGNVARNENEAPNLELATGESPVLADD